MAGIIIIIFYFGFIAITKNYSIILGQREREEAMLQSKCLLHLVGGIKDVKVTNSEDYFIHNFGETSERLARMYRRKSMLAMIPRPIMESLCICGLLLVIAIRVLLGMNISNMIPVLSVFAVAAFRMLPEFNRISGYVHSILLGKSAVEDLYRDVREVEEMTGNQKNVMSLVRLI